MKKVSLKYKEFQLLQNLKKSFFVLFLGSWQLKHVDFTFLGSIIDLDILIFEVLVEIGDEVEEYVVNDVKATTLPYFAIYTNGTLQNSFEGYQLDTTSSKYLFPVLENSYDNIKKCEQPGAIMSLLLSDNPVSSTRYLFISGDRSSVGKSSTCMAILAALLKMGADPSSLAYIKPVTQCEASQPVTAFCEQSGVAHRSIGPVVFYKGFTRAYLAGETDSCEVLMSQAIEAVHTIGKGKRLVLVDGVGYPAVGSICNLSNADVANALQCPVLLIGKEGVGDAVDSYNMNACYFELKNVTVLGGIFNKLPVDGFYKLEACKTAVTSYFQQFRPHQMPYGFMPLVKVIDNTSSTLDDLLSDAVLQYCDLDRLIHDVWMAPILYDINHTTAFQIQEPQQHVMEVSEDDSWRNVNVPVSLTKRMTPITAGASRHNSSGAILPTPTSTMKSPTVHTNNAALHQTRVISKPMDVKQSDNRGVKRSREEVERDAVASGAKGG